MSDPQSPFALSDALVESLAALRPMQATFWGVSGYDDRWDDLSPEGVARVADALRSWRARVRALPPQSDRWGKPAVPVMPDAVQLALDGIGPVKHLADPNPLASSVPDVRADGRADRRRRRPGGRDHPRRDPRARAPSLEPMLVSQQHVIRTRATCHVHVL